MSSFAPSPSLFSLRLYCLQTVFQLFIPPMSYWSLWLVHILSSIQSFYYFPSIHPVSSLFLISSQHIFPWQQTYSLHSLECLTSSFFPHVHHIQTVFYILLPHAQLVLEMLNRLAYETVAQIVDLALLVKRDANGHNSDLSRFRTPTAFNPDYPCVFIHQVRTQRMYLWCV